MNLISASARPTNHDLFARLFFADGPAADRGPEMQQFGRFVGSWDLDVIYYDEQGEIRRRSAGEWHFAWVLEGRAIADVWMIPPYAERPKSGPPPGEFGMTVRFYDPEIAAWRSTWHGPVNRFVLPFIARDAGDEMILERTEEDGTITRWIFSDIAPDSFRWRAVSSRDRGASWRLDQQMSALRRGAPAGIH